MQKNIIIMGEWGKEFHVFCSYYKYRDQYNVVLFTSSLFTKDKEFPHSLAGDPYQEGIPIESEDDLAILIKKYKVDEVVFAKSNISFEAISCLEKQIRLLGVDFKFAEVERSMLKAPGKSIVICQTQSNIDQLTGVLKKLIKSLLVYNKKMALYFPPNAQCLELPQQRYSGATKTKEYVCYTKQGLTVYTGVFYREMVKSTDEEIVLWSAEHGDIPWIEPNLHIVMVNSNEGEEWAYYPARVNCELADVILLDTKVRSNEVIDRLSTINSKAVILEWDFDNGEEVPEPLRKIMDNLINN